MLVSSHASTDAVYQCRMSVMELIIVEMRQMKDIGMHDALVSYCCISFLLFCYFFGQRTFVCPIVPVYISVSECRMNAEVLFGERCMTDITCCAIFIHDRLFRKHVAPTDFIK